jgi:small-conductance mechanosensitive channel
MVEICLTKVLIVSIVLQIILVTIICKLLSQLNKASIKYEAEHEPSKQLLNCGMFLTGITILILVISVMYIYNGNGNETPEVTPRLAFKNVDYL